MSVLSPEQSTSLRPLPVIHIPRYFLERPSDTLYPARRSREAIAASRMSPSDQQMEALSHVLKGIMAHGLPRRTDNRQDPRFAFYETPIEIASPTLSGARLAVHFRSLRRCTHANPTPHDLTWFEQKGQRAREHEAKGLPSDTKHLETLVSWQMYMCDPEDTPVPIANAVKADLGLRPAASGCLAEDGLYLNGFDYSARTTPERAEEFTGFARNILIHLNLANGELVA